MANPITISGFFSSPELQERLLALCRSQGWTIAQWENGQVTGLVGFPDIILSDDPHRLLQLLTPSITSDVFAGLSILISDELLPIPGVLCLSPSCSDDAIVHTVTTALNVERFDTQFFSANETAEPITNLPMHAESLQFMNRFRGKSVGLVIFQIDHASHLYANLDPVAKTDLLDATARFISSFSPPESHIALYDAGCFIIWLPNTEPKTVEHCAKQIHAQSHTSISFHGNHLHLTATVAHGHQAQLHDPETLWHRVWEARSEGCDIGGDQVIDARTRTENANLSQRIPQALTRNEFLLAVQPQWELQNERISGVEALLRWQGLDIGTLSPEHFIPIAEQDGQMARVGDWVLERTCYSASTWFEHLLTPINLGVNVSPQQFTNGAILDQIKRLVKQNWLDPTMLELELSHQNMLQVIDHYRNTVFELKDLGVRFALDNLGLELIETTTLLRCPADSLKIDRTIVAKVAQDPNAQILAEQICQLANKFNLRSIAVGVEEEQQRASLQAMGCSDAQGYLLCQPLALDEFQSYFSEHAQTGPRIAHR